MLRATGSSGVSRAVRPSRTPARPSPTDPPEVPVLWIDDEVDPDNAAILILRHAGVAVTCAQTAAEGLRLAKLNTFRAILLDLRLPDGDGLQVLRELRREGVAVPVMIAMTSISLESGGSKLSKMVVPSLVVADAQGEVVGSWLGVVSDARAREIGGTLDGLLCPEGCPSAPR